ncbi:MAG: hypothetical protein J1D77_02380 [Muribaculaceae bacterium]|nr:hypothetical protein [Muribaculaceae bacterium]
MKKVFLSLAVIFSVALVSCGGHKAAEEAQEEAPVEEVVEAVAATDTVNAGTDSQQIDTVVAVGAVEAQPEAPAAN